MKTIDKKHFTVRITTLVFLLFSCFYMYDFYKCLSGFIANGFREPLVMLPIILSFFLPVFSFLVFVYDFYVKALQRSVKICYSAFVIVYAIVDLILIFSNISLYASNNSLGAYNSLPSIFLHFPAVESEGITCHGSWVHGNSSEAHGQDSVLWLT